MVILHLRDSQRITARLRPDWSTSEFQASQRDIARLLHEKEKRQGWICLLLKCSINEGFFSFFLFLLL